MTSSARLLFPSHTQDASKRWDALCFKIHNFGQDMLQEA